MKQTLDHLPAHKQKELRAILDVIRKLAEVEMIILFGSYARGDYVEDPEGGYFSDWDVMVLVQNERMVDNHDLWSKIEDRAEKRTSGIPVELLVHTVKDVNRKLERGWYFFADVYEEGIMLYDSYRTQLAEPKEMTLAQRQVFAQECFDGYAEQGDQFYGSHELQMQQGWNKLAAFSLHQATETYYKAMLLVFTAYRPKQHNIEKLGNRCRNLHEAMGGIFPMDTPEDEARFKLLKAAYVDARYSTKYSITREDLDILASHIRALRARTERLCREHIAELTAAAREATE